MGQIFYELFSHFRSDVKWEKAISRKKGSKKGPKWPFFEKKSKYNFCLLIFCTQICFHNFDYFKGDKVMTFQRWQVLSWPWNFMTSYFMTKRKSWPLTLHGRFTHIYKHILKFTEKSVTWPSASGWVGLEWPLRHIFLFSFSSL